MPNEMTFTPKEIQEAQRLRTIHMIDIWSANLISNINSMMLGGIVTDPQLSLLDCLDALERLDRLKRRLAGEQPETEHLATRLREHLGEQLSLPIDGGAR